MGLNAASYVQKEKILDREDAPNRSSFNSGATGTRAFYDLLSETGRKVVRWQKKFPASGEFDSTEFSTFVIVGAVRRDFRQKEIEHILNWVSAGGTLVVIDREPPDDFFSTTANWEVTNSPSEESTFMIDPSNQSQMVAKTSAVKSVQSSIFTFNVNAIQPSKFASSVTVKRVYNQAEDDPEETDESESENSDSQMIESGNTKIDEVFEESSRTTIEPIEVPEENSNTDEIFETARTAPVIHFADDEKNLLVDFRYDSGQIVVLTDPYIVSNGGIKLVDNAQLATNVVGLRKGIIAFDEYHQGYGLDESRLLQYFAGTPVVPIFLQLFLVAGVIFFSQSRRFARALPNGEPDRLSKLEYVSAMAQLQGRTKAYDLAIENIYKEFRRRVSRLVGIDNHTASREDIAEKIAERTDYKTEEIAELMFKCEDIMHGEPTKKREIVDLIGKLRRIEEAVGLRRSKRTRPR